STAKRVRRHGVDPNRSFNEEITIKTSRMAKCQPPSLPVAPVATSGRLDLRQGHRHLRLGLADLPRPVAGCGTPGNDRKLAIFVDFAPELQATRSPPFLNQISRVRHQESG
ncbi:hypothetical protein Prudu_1440S001800, partial [Prunus dulcis]